MDDGSPRGALVQSVHALLLVGGHYVLQLRDDRPDVTGAGLWGLFGGTLQEGERPEDGLARELGEELGIAVTPGRLVWTADGRSEFGETPKRWWFFEVDASDPWEKHSLYEGQAAGVFEYGEAVRMPMTPLTREALRRHHGEART